MLDRLAASDFQPLVGSPFEVTAGGEKIALTLIEVRPLGHSPGAPRQEPFTLLFRGPRSLFLPQATYSFEHPAMGALEIFVVPVRADAAAVDYEAVFN